MRHVFVSSTFRDMQAERDMLHTMVIPELNAMALEYGESVGFIDLRWGVNTGDMDTESGAKKVLSVCLDEIDHCKPYMVIFLGERYGWIPDGQLMSNAASEKNFTLDDMEKSVTALEIEYGALSKEDNLEHCIFCIREPLPYDKMTKQQQADYASESPLHKQRLDSLKMRITKLLNEKVITYKANWDETNEKITGLQPLAQALCKRFSEMFSREWQQYNSYTWQQKEQLAFRTYADEKCSRFAGREHLLSLYKNELLNDDTRIFLLQGQTGSGKSSILSMLAKRLEAEDNNLFLFFCGNSANSCEAEDMLKQIIYYVETQLNIKKHFGEDKAEEKANNDDNETKNITIADLQNEFAVLAQRYGFSEKKPLVMIFDAIDQMNSNEILEQFAWIPQVIPQNIKLVISCLSSYKIPSHFPCGKYLKTQLLESFDVNESEEFIQGILRANSKGLDKEVINELKSKQGADTPLYISVLLQRLLIMDIDDFKEADKLGAGGIGLNKQMINLIHSCPTELNALCAALLFEAAERINTELCTQALLLLSTARYGLRLSDLEAIFISAGYEWNSLDFSRLTKYMYSYFTLRSDGRIDFTHQSIRKGIQAKNHEKEKHYHHLILQQIKALPIADAFRVSEALYHAYQINDIEFAVNFMAVALNISDDASKIAAKELKTICVQDNAKWLIAILKTQAAYKVYDIESFIKFIIGELQDTFKMTTKEREVATLIVNEASIYLINILKTNNTEPFKICYVESLYLLGKYTEDLANHKLALEYYDKYCTACKEWLEELCEAGEDIEDCMQRIIKGVKKIASIFEQNGDYTEAIEYYKIVISMAEDQCKENPRKFNKRLLSKCYNSMATVLLWVNDYNKSAEYRIKSIEISEEIFDEDPSADNL